MGDVRAVGARRAIAPTGVVKLSYAVASSARSGSPAASREVVLSIKNSTNSWTAGEKRWPPLRDNLQWPHHDFVRKLDRLKSVVFDFLSDTGLWHDRNTRTDVATRIVPTTERSRV